MVAASVQGQPVFRLPTTRAGRESARTSRRGLVSGLAAHLEGRLLRRPQTTAGGGAIVKAAYSLQRKARRAQLRARGLCSKCGLVRVTRFVQCLPCRDTNAADVRACRA